MKISGKKCDDADMYYYVVMYVQSHEEESKSIFGVDERKYYIMNKSCTIKL